MKYKVEKKIDIMQHDPKKIFVYVNASSDVIDENNIICEYYYISSVKDYYRRKESRYECEIRKIDFTLRSVEEEPKISYIEGLVNRLAEMYKKTSFQEGQRAIYDIKIDEIEYCNEYLGKYMYHDSHVVLKRLSTIEDISNYFKLLSGDELDNTVIEKIKTGAY